MRRSPLKRTTSIGPGKLMERGSTFKPRAGSPASKRRAISPASKEQRAKVATECCVVCGSELVHPSHLIDRSLGGDDDPRAVVALCPQHHREYDDEALSLVEYLEPHYREEVAYAVMTVGIVRALERLTNQRWAPVERAA
jgi:hypothetical protein